MKSALLLFWDAYTYKGKVLKRNEGVSIHTDPQQIENIKQEFYKDTPRDAAVWRDGHVDSVFVTDDTFRRVCLTVNGLFCFRNDAPIEVEFPPE